MTRDEAIKYLIKPVSTSIEIGKEKQKEFEAYNMAVEALNKKGRWIVDRYCSECEWDKKDAELVCNIPTNYCPNCGAKNGGIDNE